MSMISMRFAASLVVMAGLAGCQAVPSSRPGPAPAPAPVRTPGPAPQAPLPAPPADSGATGWDVAPVVQGQWRYRSSTAESVAEFGASNMQPSFAMRCVKPSRQIALTLAGYRTAGTVVIRTSAGVLQWNGQAMPQGGGSVLTITRAANDPGFDWMAYSRGRISIEPTSSPRFLLPVVAEIGRVIEDCRG